CVIRWAAGIEIARAAENMKSRTYIPLIAILLSGAFPAFSQKEPGKKITVWGVIEGADTIPISTLPDIHVYAPITFKNKQQQEKYGKLVKNVKKAYPYAVLAGIKIREYDAKLATLKTEVERKAYMKKAEKELMDQFEKDIKQLTMSQGRILIRLIDRETGTTSYELLKELRGSFSAFMWQAVASLWGNNLKTEYDPTQGEDKLIEGIIHRIQNGTI
ncbi:MAG: DUF4294 domain-containing protein, partial [Bacteroidota bacterium]